MATSYLLLLAYEWAAGHASTLLAQRSSSAAHSVRTGRLRPNSDVATRPRTTVRIRRDRRVQPLRSSWTIARAALIYRADLILLSVNALRLLYEHRRSPLHCTCSQKLFVLPLPFSRCRATVRRVYARASDRHINALYLCGSVATSCCDFGPSERSPAPAIVGALALEALTR